MRKFLYAIPFLALFAYGANINNPSRITVKETDGSPSVSGVRTINVSSGTLTDNGSGSVTILTGGGGGGSSFTNDDVILSTMTTGATTFIFNQDTLQSGATFFVSSGTVHHLTISTAIVTQFLEFKEFAEPSIPTNGFRLYAKDENGVTVLEGLDPDGITHHLLREQYIVARNVTESILNTGDVVYISGSTGQVPEVSKAKADSIATLPAVGIVQEDIADNGFGLVTTDGLIEDLDTSSFSEGDSLYVSSVTAGALTTETPPDYLQPVAKVMVSHANQGEMIVNVNAVISKDIVILNRDTLQSGATAYPDFLYVGSSATITGELNPLGGVADGTLEEADISDLTHTSTSSIAGGSDSHVQYNDGGDFGGSSGFVFDDSTVFVGIGTDTPSARLHIKELGPTIRMEPDAVPIGHAGSFISHFKYLGTSPEVYVGYNEVTTNSGSAGERNVGYSITDGNSGGNFNSSGELVRFEREDEKRTIILAGPLSLYFENETQYFDSDASNYVGFKSTATLSGNQIWVLPPADGTAAQVIHTDGSGNLYFDDDDSGGGGGGSTGVAIDEDDLSFDTNVSTLNFVNNSGLGTIWDLDGDGDQVDITISSSGVGFLHSTQTYTGSKTYSSSVTISQDLDINGTLSLTNGFGNTGAVVITGETSAPSWGFIGTEQMNDDGNPLDGDFLKVAAGGASFTWLTPHAGTSIENDLEEENHVSEHQNGGADELDVTGLSGLLADPQGVVISTDSFVVGTSTGINFIPGSNVTISAVETGNRMDVTINASSIESFNANASLTSTHTVVLASATASSSITITLPSASSNSGQKIQITKTDLSTNTIIIEGDGSDLVLGEDSFSLASYNQSQMLVSDGSSNWFSIGPVTYTPAFLGAHGDPNSAATGSANAAYMMAVTVDYPCTLKGIEVTIGTSSGNLDVGVYDNNGNLISSSGSTASPGTGPQEIDFSSPAVLKTPGTYWLAVAIDNTTISLTRVGINGSIVFASSGATYPLPSSIAVDGTSNRPFRLIGITYGGAQ